MKIVLDTNVLISGLFWPGGPPRIILDMWLSGRISVLASQEIVDEYRGVVQRLGQKRNVDVRKLLERLLMMVDYVMTSPLPTQVCDDPDDDKFLAAATAGRVKYLVTGDRALLRVGRFRKTEIVTPSTFLKSC